MSFDWHFWHEEQPGAGRDIKILHITLNRENPSLPPVARYDIVNADEAEFRYPGEVIVAWRYTR